MTTVFSALLLFSFAELGTPPSKAELFVVFPALTPEEKEIESGQISLPISTTFSQKSVSLFLPSETNSATYTSKASLFSLA